MELRKHKKILLSVILFFVLGLILFYYLNSSIRSIVNIIILSFILSYTLDPIRSLFEVKLKVSKRLASILVILIIMGIFITCIISIIPMLFKEVSNINSIYDTISDFLEGLYTRFNLGSIPGIDVLYNETLEKGNTIWMSFSENALDNLIKFCNNLITFALVPIIVYYFLCDGNRIYNKILLVLPTEKRKIIKKILSDIDKILTRYIIGQLLLSGLIGILTFIVLIILHIKFPFWISILNAIFNIIPYFGPIFGMIPVILIALLDSPMKALWAAIGMIIIQQIEGNILSPKITGESTDIHPFVIIILLLVGDKFGGFIGMILVVPIAVMIKVLYDDINYYLF